MGSYMEYLLIILAFIVIISLLGWFHSGKKAAQRKNTKKDSGKTASNVKCPICGSGLAAGENLISKVYRPMNVPDQLMSIMGCPHCYPKGGQGIKRICPVCHQLMDDDDILTARLFNKSAGRKHVHILGCSKCHRQH